MPQQEKAIGPGQLSTSHSDERAGTIGTIGQNLVVPVSPLKQRREWSHKDESRS